MGHAPETLEHAHHIAHGGHEGDRLGMLVGITMALLGVLLAFTAAKVGGERTELTKALVDQAYAHTQATSQEIKERMAVLSLQNLHAEAEVGRTSAKDMLQMADAADLYGREATSATAWVDGYDPLIDELAESQEHYERSQLAAEFGIVVASIALLLKKRWPWIASLALGVLAVGLLVQTYVHSSSVIHDSDHKIEEAEKTYESMVDANKTATSDRAFLEDIRKTYGAAAPAPAPK